MRFQEIYKRCKDSLDIFPSVPRLSDITDASVIKELVSLIQDALDVLPATGLFEAEISAFNNFAEETANEFIPSLSINNLSLNFKAANDLVRRFINEAVKTKEKIEIIVRLFESANYKQDTCGFDIKLPPDMSLSELSKCAKDLDTIFSTCPIFKDKGAISFSAVDVGSVWFSFVIGGAVVATLGAIAAFVDKALVMRSHYITTKQQEEDLKRMKLGNELLEKYVEVNNSISDKLLDNAIEDLAHNHNINEPEDRERIRHSIKLMTDWMSKGMEIYPSVIAPPETKAVFPPVERQALPKSVSALLDDGDATEE